MVVLEEAESVPLGIHFPIALAVLPAFVPLLFRRFPLLRVTFMTRVFLFRLHWVYFFLTVHQRLLLRFWPIYSRFRLQKLYIFRFWKCNVQFVLEKFLLPRLRFCHPYFTVEKFRLASRHLLNTSFFVLKEIRVFTLFEMLMVFLFVEQTRFCVVSL